MPSSAKNSTANRFRQLQLPEHLETHAAGVKLTYRRLGNGPVIFCLPPWPLSSAVFVPVATLLKDKFDFICLDLPGWGGESPKVQKELDFMDYTDLAAEFITSFQLHDYHLMGYSFGGCLAQELISKKKVQPEKLVLISTFNQGEALKKKYFNMISITQKGYDLYQNLKRTDFYKKMKRTGNRELVFKLVDLYYRLFMIDLSHHDKITRSDFYQKFLIENSKLDLDTVLKAAVSLADASIPAASLSTLPCLLIYGDSDLDFVRAQSKEIAIELAISPRIIPSANHHHLFFSADLSAKYLGTFLSA